MSQIGDGEKDRQPAQPSHKTDREEFCADHQDFDTALAEMLRVFGPRTGEDWTVPAGPLERTCRQTAAHTRRVCPWTGWHQHR